MNGCTCHQELKDEFEQLMPRITMYLKSVFRFIRCESTRSDYIAEGIALSWKWFCRAKQQGKNPAEFVTSIARYAARAVRAGRTVCGQQKSKDVLSVTARLKFGVSVVRFAPSVDCELSGALVRTQHEDMVYEEYVTDDMQTPVPEQAAFRVDWPDFLDTLSARDRGIAAFLALGHQATEAATKFNVTVPRISQVRKDWQRRWFEFHVGRM